MTTRTYNFRTRAETGTAVQSRASDVSGSHRRSRVVISRDLPPHIPSLVADAEPNAALYSDIVASRPPSPRKEVDAVLARDVASDHSEGGMLEESNSPVPKRIETSYDEDEAPDFGENESRSSWTTVKRRRARSLSSLDLARSIRKGNEVPGQRLTNEQVQAVRKATTNLTTPQRNTIRRRQEKIPVGRDSSTSSRDEGPSNLKGKGIDPREWGNVNISRESLNPEAQAAALASFAQQSKDKDGQQRRTHQKKNKTGADRPPRPAHIPAESRPVAQIALNSYLGTALHNVGRHDRRRKPGGDDSPSSSESLDHDSTTSSGGDDSESGGSSSGSSHEQRSRRDNRHGRNKRRRKSPYGKKTLIKPIAPKEYDGQADARAYHRFVRESEAYL